MTGPARYTSPPCLACAGGGDPTAVDPQQALDVARWRRAARVALLDARAALGVAERQALAAQIAVQLDAVLRSRFGTVAGLVLSGYWPIKSEPDLRPWMAAMQAAGARLALPVVETRAAPLVFRPWAPGAAMERGHWNIPVPATALTVTPDIVLAPLVGWDGAGYRLGYGGGYFDRTLAAAQPRPFAIGVGLDAARLPTIFPQPHDIGLDAIATETAFRFPPVTPGPDG